MKLEKEAELYLRAQSENSALYTKLPTKNQEYYQMDPKSIQYQTPQEESITESPLAPSLSTRAANDSDPDQIFYTNSEALATKSTPVSKTYSIFKGKAINKGASSAELMLHWAQDVPSNALPSEPSCSPASQPSVISGINTTDSVSQVGEYNKEDGTTLEQEEPTNSNDILKEMIITAIEEINKGWQQWGTKFYLVRPSRISTSFVWEPANGFQLGDKDDARFWICTRCVQDKRKHTKDRAIIFSCKHQTNPATNHLLNEHFINKSGLVPLLRRKGIHKNQGVIAKHKLDPIAESTADIATHLSSRFDPHQFFILLLSWIILNNIAFRTIETPEFTDLIDYLNPLATESLVSHQTVGRQVMKLFYDHIPTVQNLLSKAISRIYISFDLWSSSNNIALAGIVVHFVDYNLRQWNFLIGLPAHYGGHDSRSIS